MTNPQRNPIRPLRPRRRQRGAFALLAVVMMITLVAFSLRTLLQTGSSATYATSVNANGIRAFAAAESALDLALTRLTESGPDSCQPASFVGATTAHASFAFDVVEPLPNLDSPLACNGSTGCRIRVTGSAGTANDNAKRSLNMDVAYCLPSENGTTGRANAASQRVNVDKPGSATVMILGFSSHQKGISGGTARYDGCSWALGACAARWNSASSKGVVSIVGVGSVAIADTSGYLAVNHRFSNERTYTGVGAIFSPLTTSAVSVVGHWSEDRNNAANKTVGDNSGASSLKGNAPNGRSSWCKDADTMVIGLSAIADDRAEGLTNVIWRPATASPTGQALKPLQRYVSRSYEAGDDTTPKKERFIYTEIWYTHNALHPSKTVPELFNANGSTAAEFELTLRNRSTTHWVAGITCLKHVDPNVVRGIDYQFWPTWWERF
jgi:hypothetical protein